MFEKYLSVILIVVASVSNCRTSNLNRCDILAANPQLL